MTRRHFSSLSIRIGAGLLLAALVVVGVIAPVRPVKAQQLRRVVLPPIHLPPNHTLRLSVLNIGPAPANVDLQLLSASDSSLIASSGTFLLGNGRGAFHTFSVGPTFVAPAMLTGMAGQDWFVFSAQMFDPNGATVGIVATDFNRDGGLDF